MPRKRDPSVFTTSVSGISDEAWAAFKEEVARFQKLVNNSCTLRLALEQAVLFIRDEINHRVGSGSQMAMYPLNGVSSKPVSIQIGNTYRDDLRYCSKITGYKQNVLLLNGMLLTALYMDEHSMNIEHASLEKDVFEKLEQGETFLHKDTRKMLNRVELQDAIMEDYIETKDKNINQLYLRMTGKPNPNPSSSGYGYMSHGIKSA